MIQLSKTGIPAVLEASFELWTQVLRDHQAAGTQPTATEKTRYRHADIKLALILETKGKCAYCESKLRHITYGDVEHIIPKSTSVERTFEWANLTLACDVCNTNKSNHFGTHDDLVDPYIVDPSDHLDFLGAVVLAAPGSAAGHATESTIRLNRIELLERRAERLQQVCKQLHLLVEVTDENRRAVIRRDLEREYADDMEYSAIVKQYVLDQLARIDAKMQGGAVGVVAGA